MRKNLLGFALLITLLTILLTFSVSAAVPEVSISNATVEAGSTVSVNITLDENPGLIVLKARIKYNDTYFSVKSVKDGGLLGENTHSINYTKSPYTLFWANPLLKTDITKNGKIATITFDVDEDTPAGKYKLDLIIDDEDVVTTDLKEIGDEFACYSGTITVTNDNDDEEDEEDEDEGSPKLYIDDTKVTAGKNFSLTLKISDNPGIVALRTYLDYNDKYFEVVSVKDHGLIGELVSPEESDESPYTIFCTDPLSEDDIDDDGKLVTITFSSKSSTPAGKYDFKLSSDKADILNTDLDKLGKKFKFDGAVVTVSKADDDEEEDEEDEDDDTPTLSIEDTNVAAGEEFTLTLKISNNPGIIALRTYLDYNDKYFEITKVKDHELIGELRSPEENDDSPYAIFCSDPLSEDNIDDNGKIVTITFKSKSSTPYGKYDFKLSGNKADIIDTDLEQLGKKFKYDGAVVTVSKDGKDEAEKDYTLSLKNNNSTISIVYNEGTFISLDSATLKAAVEEALDKYPTKKIDVIIAAKGIASNGGTVFFPSNYGAELKIVNNLRIELENVTLDFDANALKTFVSANNSIMLTLGTAKLDQKLAGTLANAYQYYDISLTQKITSGNVKVTLPYQKAATVNTNDIIIYAVDNGKLTSVPSKATYSHSTQSNGFLTFTDTGIRPYVVTTATKVNFTDITNHWAKDSINFVAARGIFNGTSATTFNPEGELSRGMLVTVLGRLEGVDVSSYNCTFADVNKNQYYAPYIEWARTNNIVGGVGDNKFEPDRVVNRQEMAVIIARYLTYKGHSLVNTEVKYSDSATIASWAKTAVNQVGNAGIITGADGAFLPTNTANRAQAAAILQRIVNFVG